MKITAEPRSDQWNADDFVGSSRTFTIAGVKPGRAEQKYDIDLVEGEGRVWRPPLTILRLLIHAWGDEAAVWVGRRVTLYRDPSVRFGGDQVGGIRVSHVSDLPDGKSFTVKLTSARGHKEAMTVQPLAEVAPALTEPTPQQLAACTDVDALTAWLEVSRSMVQERINARIAELTATPDPEFDQPLIGAHE